MGLWLKKLWIRLTGRSDIHSFNDEAPAEGTIRYEFMDGVTFEVLYGKVTHRFTSYTGKNKVFVRVWTKIVKD